MSTLDLLTAERAHTAVRRTATETLTGGNAGADAHPLHALQRTAGNAAVVAELQREEGAGGGGRSPVLDVVGRGGGRPLDAPVRSEMEGALGADFSDVRIHDDSSAKSTAESVGAHAFTTGNEIVFGEGAYSPGSTEGKRTLAHELTHVIQQRQGPVDGTSSGDGVAISDPGDKFEREASSHAEHVVTTGVAPGVSLQQAAGAGASVQRHETGAAHEDAVQMIALQREGAAPEEEKEEPAQMIALQREEAPEEEEMPS